MRGLQPERISKCSRGGITNRNAQKLYDLPVAGFPVDRLKPAFLLSDGSQGSYGAFEAGVARYLWGGSEPAGSGLASFMPLNTFWNVASSEGAMTMVYPITAIVILPST